jgi:dolichol-phosphate mannosyltransferase
LVAQFESNLTGDDAETMKAMIIIPTYNEKENIEKLVPIILAMEDGFDVVIVDDNSPDGTGQLADQLARESPRVHALHRPAKLGLGTAYLDRFKTSLAAGHHNPALKISVPGLSRMARCERS